MDGGYLTDPSHLDECSSYVLSLSLTIVHIAARVTRIAYRAAAAISSLKASALHRHRAVQPLPPYAPRAIVHKSSALRPANPLIVDARVALDAGGLINRIERIAHIGPDETRSPSVEIVASPE